MYKGRVTAPNIRSATAILMTRNKLFFRSLWLVTKRTMVSRFSTTIKIAANMKTLHQTMASGLDGKSMDDVDLYSSLILFADVLFIADINRL